MVKALDFLDPAGHGPSLAFLVKALLAILNAAPLFTQEYTLVPTTEEPHVKVTSWLWVIFFGPGKMPMHFLTQKCNHAINNANELATWVQPEFPTC